MRSWRVLVAWFLLPVAWGSAQAPDSVREQAVEPAPVPLSSDRPGYANSTSVAPVLRPITELGATVAWDPDDPTVGTFPDLRIRFGIARWMELRIDAPTVVFADPFAVGDLGLALKLGSRVAGSLSVSVIPSVTVPVSSGGAASARLELNWSASAGRVGFGGNLAAGSVPTAMGRRLRGEGSVAVSFKAHPKLGLYAQAFALWTDGEDPRPYAGLGLYARPHPRVQTDLYADVGLTDATTRLILGAGLTVLWGSEVVPRP